MELMEIKDSSCPICGADIVAERRDRKHTNGHYNEMREFSCGLRLHYSPNFRTTEYSTAYVCKNDPVIAVRKEKEAEALRKMTNYVNSKAVDLDTDMKEVVIRRIDSALKFGW